MPTNEKPAPGVIRGAGYCDASNCCNHTAIRIRLKTIIVFLAIWGLIPAALALWLIQRGGMRDA